MANPPKAKADPLTAAKARVADLERRKAVKAEVDAAAKALKTAREKAKRK